MQQTINYILSNISQYKLQSDEAYIAYLSSLDEGVLVKLRGAIDRIIASNPDYNNFKKAMQVFVDSLDETISEL